MAWLGGFVSPPQAAGPSPISDFWYRPYFGDTSEAGIAVGPDTIYRCGVVLAAIRFKATSAALCKPKVAIRLPNGRREPDPDSPVARLLHRPAPWLSHFEWTRLQVLRLSQFGQAFSRIHPGADYFAGSLWPMLPRAHGDASGTGCRVLDQSADGTLLYGYRARVGGPEERLHQSEVLHYSDLSSDGFEGMPTYALIRNAVGIALAAEKHTSAFFRQGTRLSGLLSTDRELTPAKRAEINQSWKASFAGNDNVGKVAVVGDGMKFTAMAIDHQKAQFLELTDQVVGLILMALGVPGVVVGWTGDKTSTYASAESFFQEGGLQGCLLPILGNMEAREEMSLLLDDDRRFIKRELDALARANIVKRYQAYAIAAGGPWATRNEIRALEDENAHADPSMDQVLPPRGIAPLGATESESEDPPPRDRRRARSDNDEDAGASAIAASARMVLAENLDLQRLAARAKDLAAINALAVVRREIGAIAGQPERRAAGLAVKFAGNQESFRAAVLDFYQGHARHVQERLQLTEEQAAAYVQSQVSALLGDGVAVVDHWEATVPPRLVAMALGGAAA